MERKEKEIRELEEYLNREEPVGITTSEYKELKELRNLVKTIKAKMFYLSVEIPMCNDIVRINELLKDW